MTEKLVGLSLSMCIKDIIEGKVALEQVIMIITGTRAITQLDWDKLVTIYCQTAWESNPEKATKILQTLLYENKIIQPRVLDLDPPNIADGWWDSPSNYESIGGNA